MLHLPRLPSCFGWMFLCLASCTAEEPSDLELCQQDATAECCVNEDCGEDFICDFDAGCGVMGSGEVECGEASGTQTCHSLCTGGQACADPSQSCVQVEQFNWGDSGTLYEACF